MKKKSKRSLTAYQKRRDFKKTPEPKNNTSKKRTKRLIFVIQKHAARQLHYDFRLQIGNTLVSWAIPKGPSLNPHVKRLAVMTEDHPLAYAKFEGVIPKGEYGGGTVMVWDKGTYKNIKTKNGKPVSMAQCLKDGQIEVFLYGKKFKGGFVLIRLKQDEKNWLLKKIDDEYAHARRNPVTSQPKSVLTNRTMHQITKEES